MAVRVSDCISYHGRAGVPVLIEGDDYRIEGAFVCAHRMPLWHRLRAAWILVWAPVYRKRPASPKISGAIHS